MNKRTKALNQQNNQLDKAIHPENQPIFTDMICYLRGANISEYEIEVVRQDLTEMVLSAQNRGDSIESLFDGDYQQFCDEVINSLPPKTTKQKLIDGLDIVFLGLAILIPINILLSKDTILLIGKLFQKQPVNWNIPVSIGTVLSMVLIIGLATTIVMLITKNAFRQDKKEKLLLGVVAGVGTTLVMVALFVFGRKTLFTVNLWLALAVALVFFLGRKLLDSVSY